MNKYVIAGALVGSILGTALKYTLIAGVIVGSLHLFGVL